MYALTNVKIVCAGKITENKVLRFNKKIEEWADIPAPGDTVIDGKGLYCSAGFIDQHIHGYGGIDTMDASVEQLLGIAENLAQNGVTAFCPTTMTMSKERIVSAFETVRAAMKAQQNGAQILGCHMEGPFISSQKKGAQDESYIVAPSYQMIEEYTDVIRLISYAPENDPTGEFAKMITSAGICASLGHTTADYDTAIAAYDAGASGTTHFFNAMPPLTHRQPGVVGAALQREDVYIELIADTIHVHPALFSTLCKCKPSHLILITDAIEATGCPDGQYQLGGQPVFVKNGAARLSDGTLAGSTLKLNTAVHNILKHTSLSLPQVIDLATRNAAQYLHLQNKGSVEVGKDADIILFDKDITIHRTFCGGNLCFEK